MITMTRISKKEMAKRAKTMDMRISGAEVKKLWETGKISQAEYIAYRQGKIINILENIK